MRALGEEFRAAREARGLSPSDVAEQIHIRSVYLQALEREDWATIGAPVYVRGFIRTYARFLGLDPESAVQRFNESTGAAPSAAAAPREPRAQERRQPSPLLWLAAALALGLVGYVGYNLYGLTVADHTDRTPATVAVVTPPDQSTPGASAAPTAAPSPTATPTKPPTRTMVVRVSEPSWLRVVVDGQNEMEGIFPAGTVKTFHGKTATVRVGNAGGVELDVNGKSVGKLGNTGDVVERTLQLARE